MSIALDLQRSLKSLERELGRPVFTWNGNNYACVANTAVAGKTLVPGGLSPLADLVLFVRVELFGTGNLPVAKQKLVHDETTYRIEDVAVMPGGSVLRISCFHSSQKL